jgi:hypothetical protein
MPPTPGPGRATPLTVALGIAAAILALSGCSRDREKVGTTRTTSAPVETLSNGVDRILAAHCTHDQLCKEFGYPNAPDSDGCAVTSAAVLERVRQECSLGITHEALDACTSAIRAAACSTEPVDLDDLPACRTSELCGNVDRLDINGNWRGFPGL